MRSLPPALRQWALVVALGLPAAARADTVWVSLPADEQRCTFERLASLVAAQRTDLELRPGLHELGLRDAQVEIFRLGERWTLSVRAVGERNLVRALPPPGTDCVDLSQTAAFMLERYLEEIHWGSDSLPRVARDAGAVPANAWHGVAELGVGALFSTLGAAPTLRLDVGASVGAWLIELSALGLLPAKITAQDDDDDGDEGPLTGVTVTILQLAGGRRFELGLGALRLELLLGAELAWQSGPATGTESGGTTVDFEPNPFIGARVGWEIPVYRRLFATLMIEGRALYLGEAPAPPWRSPPFDGDATLGVGYLFF